MAYNSLRIQGYNYGVSGLANGLSNSADDCIFPNVNVETEFGNTVKDKVQSSNNDRRPGVHIHRSKILGFFCSRGSPCWNSHRGWGERSWHRPEAVIKNGKIVKAPELDRRIDTYLRYFNGYGAIIVQMNVEDTRNGGRICY